MKKKQVGESKKELLSVPESFENVFEVGVKERRSSNISVNCATPDEICFEDDPRRTDSGAYRQNWALYNAAKTNEFIHFQDLLWHLCQIPHEDEQKRGKPRISFSDMLFITINKSYFQKFSARRFEALIKGMQRRMASSRRFPTGTLLTIS